MKKYLLLLTTVILSLPIHSQIPDSVLAMKHLDSLDALQQKFFNTGELDKLFETTMEAVNFASMVFGDSSTQYAAELFTLGASYHIIGQIDSAQQIYERLLPIVHQLPRRRGLYASILSNLAELYLLQLQYEAAEQLHIEALAIQKELYGTRHPSYAESAMTLGAVYAAMRKFKTSEEYYVKCITSLNESKNNENNLRSSVLFRYADLKYATGNFNLAEEYYLQSYTLFQQQTTPNVNEYIQLLQSMGIFYHERGNYQKGEEYYSQALLLKEEIYGLDHWSTRITQMNLGNLYAETGRYNECDSLFQLINNQYNATSQISSLNYILVNINYAHVYLDRNEFKACDSILNEILPTVSNLPSIPMNEYREIVQACGALKLELGDLVAADSLLSIAEDLTVADSLINTEFNLQLQAQLAATSYRRGEWQRAENYRSEFVKRYYDLIQLHSLFASENEMQAYIRNMEKYTGSYFSYLYINPTSSKIEEALNLVLYNKRFLLHEIQLIKKNLSMDSVASVYFEELTAVRSILAELYALPYHQRPSVDTLDHRATELEKKIISRVADYQKNTELISWTEIQKKLGPQEAYIEFFNFNYFPGRRTDSILYCAFLIRPGDEKPILIPLFEKKQLEELFPSDEGNRNDQISKLYSNTDILALLWWPIDPFLKTTQAVYYSLSGLLHKINLNAFATSHKATVGDLYSFSHIGNPRQFISDMDDGSGQNGCALFGGLNYELDTSALHIPPDLEFIETHPNKVSPPSFTSVSTSRGNTWTFLPGSAQEIHQINPIFKKAKYTFEVAEKDSGTEEAFKQLSQSSNRKYSPDIIHISTHGFFFPDPKTDFTSIPFYGEPIFKISDNPMIRSGLILTGGNYAWKHGHPYKPGMEDGILTAYEISQMDLSNTELVVLSACETGLGDIKGNEGVYGLQRAFKIAGVKNLIMSLWKVPDAATAELMISFYKHWLEDKMTIRQALHTAQKELRDEGFEPFYWAGWVLVE